MDFNKTINRWHTGCVKYDGLQQNYGRSDLLPLWVADMDFEVCPAITEALRHRLEHQVFGYSIAPDSYWQSIQDWLLNRHRFSVERDELTFIPGIVRGLAMALQVFTDKGDKVLIQQPVYHPFRIIIEGNCRKVVRNPLRFCDDGHVEMDFELLVLPTSAPNTACWWRATKSTATLSCLATATLRLPPFPTQRRNAASRLARRRRHSTSPAS